MYLFVNTSYKKMKNINKVICMFIICLTIVSSIVSPVFGFVSDTNLEDAIKDTAAFIYKTVANPQVGSIGGEWAVLGLARSGYDVPEDYYEKYYANVEKYVKDLKGNLHDKKYTEYSRIIVALSSIGKDARDVGGYDLTIALGDYDKTIWQGLNGPVWALIALDSGNYPMPQNSEAETQATREMYIERILDCQLADGGWSLLGGTEYANAGEGVSDPDITGMVLQSLAKYQDNTKVKKAIEEALDCMSKMQSKDGGFSSWGTPNSESCIQMIVALCELGVPLDDERFVKNGNTILDNLMSYYKKGKGFFHTPDERSTNQMASEQGLYALVAASRARFGKNSLYRMSDSLKIKGIIGDAEPGSGLPNKNKDVIYRPITLPERSFDDITGTHAHKNQFAIEALASREIINGKTQDLFKPDETVTRAEFAAIVVRSLGLNPVKNNKFTDVPEAEWYAAYVGTANNYGIVNGNSETTFNPNGKITRQEATLMVARAAKLCGIDTEMDKGLVRDTLAQFGDYVKSDAWARDALAFCYNENILDQDDLDIRPKDNILRSEIAQMLFNMLGLANLL